MELQSLEARSLEGREPQTIGVDFPHRAPFKVSRQQIIEVFEYLYVKALLKRHGWNIGQAARASRLSRDQLLRLIGKHGLCARCDGAECGDRSRG